MGTPRLVWRDKCVLITGAASGIGWALAKAVHQRGAHVWLLDINEQVRERASQLGDRACGRRLDVSDYSEWESLIREVQDQHTSIDVLFNNAGIGFGCDAVDLTRAHYDRYIDVNIRGVTNGISLLYPKMVQQGFGTIVNTASMGGLIPSALMSPYAMTKHAVVGLSESLRQEAACKGVNIITLCPGSVDTPIFDATGLDGLPVRKATDLRQFTREKYTSITPEAFADKALADIERNKTLIIYPRPMRLIVWLYRYVPWFYNWMTRPNLAQELKRLQQP